MEENYEIEVIALNFHGKQTFLRKFKNVYQN